MYIMGDWASASRARGKKGKVVTSSCEQYELTRRHFDHDCFYQVPLVQIDFLCSCTVQELIYMIKHGTIDYTRTNDIYRGS